MWHPLQAIQLGSLDDILQNLADYKRGTIHLSIRISNLTSLIVWFSKAKLEPSSLDCIKTIEIIRFGFHISSEMCDSFFSWVLVFPYIQELDLSWVVPMDPKMWTWKLDALYVGLFLFRLQPAGITAMLEPRFALSCNRFQPESVIATALRLSSWLRSVHRD